MKIPGSPENEIEKAAEKSLETFGLADNSSTSYELSVGSVVSPIHRGVESACFNVDVDGKALFLKVRYPDMSRFFDEGAVYTETL